MLEKREALLHKKMAAELSKAKEFNRAKNKRAALQCLKKKKLYEQQVENLQNHQLKLEEQVITLEGSKTTAETFDALRSGAGAMKQLHKETNIDEVDKVMDDINEQSEKMRQVQEALGQPVGYAADMDEDELDAELAELEAEDLEKELGLEEDVAVQTGARRRAEAPRRASQRRRCRRRRPAARPCCRRSRARPTRTPSWRRCRRRWSCSGREAGSPRGRAWEGATTRRFFFWSFNKILPPPMMLTSV